MELIIKEPPKFLFDGNFEEVKKSLQDKLEQYKDLKLNAETEEKFKLVKKELVATRKIIEDKCKTALTQYVKLPENVIKAAFNDLLQVVTNVEENFDEQLDALEKERRDELTVVLNSYIDMFQKEFNLRDVSKIELKKGYYNKTAKESDTRADLKEQFNGLKDKENQYDTDCKMITVTCNGKLNPAIFIDKLSYKPVSSILMEIQNELNNPEEVLEIGVKESPELPVSDEPKVKPSAFSFVYKKKTLEIEYEESQGALIKDFFEKNEIKYRFL